MYTEKGFMFKYFKSFFSSHNIKLPAQQSAVLFSVIVLLSGIITSLFLASLVARQAHDDYQVSLDQKRNAITSQLSSAVSGYNQLLAAGATLSNLKGDLTVEDWAQFYEDMQVGRQLPVTVGVGYVSVTSSPGDNLRTAITYLQPSSEENSRAIGYDMYSEDNRQNAMKRAVDGASMAVSHLVVLVQDSTATAADNDNGRGVLMYYPVYATRVLPMTIEARHQQLKGFVYVAVRPTDILNGYYTRFPQTFDGVSVTLDDTEDGASHELATVAGAGGNAVNPQLSQGELVVGNRRWVVKVAGAADTINTTVVPLVILIGGSLLGLLLAVSMLRSILRRLENVHQSYEHEVERTKDELLALASHQLRTPASGVKQYIGILTSGIVGPLTPAQQQIAEKAFNTNERQIEIINELLYVSKIEAGKVTLRLTRSNITPAVQRSVDSLQAAAKQKNIKIVFKTKQPRYIYGDEQYYAMIVDNLISNAVKYSYPNTMVTVRISARQDNMLAIAVTDKGVGIPHGDQAQLFRKFHRINNPLTRSESGSGLGLFLAYQLARAHGGDIIVVSQEGKGSTFTLLLPTTKGAEEAQVDIVDKFGAS